MTCHMGSPAFSRWQALSLCTLLTLSRYVILYALSLTFLVYLLLTCFDCNNDISCDPMPQMWASCAAVKIVIMRVNVQCAISALVAHPCLFVPCDVNCKQIRPQHGEPSRVYMRLSVAEIPLSGASLLCSSAEQYLHHKHMPGSLPKLRILVKLHNQ